jgi:hypothetical protein
VVGQPTGTAFVFPRRERALTMSHILILCDIHLTRGKQPKEQILLIRLELHPKCGDFVATMFKAGVNSEERRIVSPGEGPRRVETEHGPSRPPSAPTPKPSPATPKPATGPAKPNTPPTRSVKVAGLRSSHALDGATAADFGAVLLY